LPSRIEIPRSERCSERSCEWRDENPTRLNPALSAGGILISAAADSIGDLLYFVGDVIAEFLSTGGRQQHSGSDAHSDSGGECEEISQRVIFVRINRVTSVFGHRRGAAGGAIHSVRSLVHEVNSCLQNRLHN